MRESTGAKIWAIAEGYIPEWSNGPEPEMESHETACILNAGDEDAHVRRSMGTAITSPSWTSTASARCSTA